MTGSSDTPAGNVPPVLLWTVKLWHRYLRFHQRGKPPKACAWPLCKHDWHDHLGDVRLCRQHHPKYDGSAFF